MAAEEKGALDEHAYLQNIPSSRYENLVKIGQGGFSRLYKAWDNERREECTIKQFTRQDDLRWVVVVSEVVVVVAAATATIVVPTFLAP